jgi:hypothetical protein
MLVIPKNLDFDSKEYSAIERYIKEEKDVVLVYKNKNGGIPKEAVHKGTIFALNTADKVIQILTKAPHSTNKGLPLVEGIEVYLKEEYNNK